MEQLDKVIAALGCCLVKEDEPCEGNCPYCGKDDCLGLMMKDVLEFLTESRTRMCGNEDLISRAVVLERLSKVVLGDAGTFSAGVQMGVDHAMGVVADAPAVAGPAFEKSAAFQQLIDAIEAERPAHPEAEYDVGYNNGLVMAQSIAYNMKTVGAEKRTERVTEK